MGVLEKIKEIELEVRKSQVNMKSIHVLEECSSMWLGARILAGKGRATANAY